MQKSIIGNLPFEGEWISTATPAFKIPSHGTFKFGVGYAYDFLKVDAKRHVSKHYSWRSFLGTEAPENFYSFGEEVLSPISGSVVEIHDGEDDNVVRRSLFAGIPYMLNQAKRIKGGITKIAGNYVIVKNEKSDEFVCIVHLKKNSITTKEGEIIKVGQKIGECGNSGNSIQPHIHVQAISDLNLLSENGIPLYFNNYFEMRNSNYELVLTPSFPNKNHPIYSNKSKYIV